MEAGCKLHLPGNGNAHIIAVAAHYFIFVEVDHFIHPHSRLAHSGQGTFVNKVGAEVFVEPLPAVAAVFPDFHALKFALYPFNVGVAATAQRYAEGGFAILRIKRRNRCLNAQVFAHGGGVGRRMGNALYKQPETVFNIGRHDYGRRVQHGLGGKGPRHLAAIAVAQQVFVIGNGLRAYDLMPGRLKMQ
jgi:hypothetical protein